ncbi:D-3-phosphoglycerate dehydrogenase [Fulvia fulva]|uniref:D-3-phosphoglycerate dehydrogenase n=1 Tax=Passalora fulva TaxID=5499 RepID=A0A9Q8LEK7_PASFU|nr:D-3-phosphoglycerate dehydrogenase [Fulvia fulva]KAK4626060.1 D-3-phosphoglycerate dehydrogenase [Fulvia fulva]KAK4628205.1 D-3-phosphoglycerate dehydrogenase [Fulvia fulva]UJO15964.1 D-3-phosphoglycerate dehydrogenase [Fulvia fulva]WPV13393.1 D-3-phosphoglycerate dehydrogenase [Fulvia fulva]WPV28335.1 D-3-phosphoglycerate dehydrogenase [Fulvia fulva]
MYSRLNSIQQHLPRSTSKTSTHTMASLPLRIAVLDDYANIAQTHFSKLQNVQVDSFPKTLNAATPKGLEALAKRLEPYKIISTMRERTAFRSALIKQLPNLKLLLTSGTRNASLDLATFSERGIPVAGTKGERPSNPDPNSDYEPPPPAGYSAVNQHAWALLLALCGRIPEDDRALKTSSTAWQSGLGISLGGKTLGLVGLGKLGTAFGRVAVQMFGMKVLAWSQNLDQEKADAAAEGAGLPKGTFEAVGKEEVFRSADVVSLHLVLSERTRGVVGKRELGWMKGSGVLVNTSRGGLIDEGALISALKEGRIKGVALDVFWEEPIAADSPWRSVDSWSKAAVVLSPHMGYVNEGTMNRWYEEQAENLDRWLKGEELLNKIN